MTAPTLAPAPTPARRPEGPRPAGPATAPATPGTPPRGSVLLAVLAVVAALVVGIAAERAVDDTWTLVAGDLVAAAGPVEPGDAVPTGEALTAGPDGARMTGDRGAVELAPATGVQLDGPSFALDDGALLAEASAASIAVTVPAGTVVGRGTYRVDRTGSARVASYDAAVALRTSVDRAVGPLQQAPLQGTGEVRPMRLDPDDQWDQRFAAGPLEIDAFAARLEAGLEATYGDGLQSPAFYGDFVGVDGALADALPRFAPRVAGPRYGPAAPTLVAAASLETLARGARLPVDAVVVTALEQRGAGATWGVLLHLEDLGADDLRRIADEVLRRRAAQGEDAAPIAPPAGTPTSTPDPQPTSPPGDPGPTPTPTPTPGPTDPPTPEPTEPPPPPEDDGPVDDVVDDVTDTIDDLIDDLLPDLPVPPVGDVVDDVTDPVTGILDGVVEPIEPVDDLVDDVGGTLDGLLDDLVPPDDLVGGADGGAHADGAAGLLDGVTDAVSGLLGLVVGLLPG